MHSISTKSAEILLDKLEEINDTGMFNRQKVYIKRLRCLATFDVQYLISELREKLLSAKSINSVIGCDEVKVVIDQDFVDDSAQIINSFIKGKSND